MEQLFDRYRSLEAHPRDKTQIVQLRKILSGIKKECNELSKLLTPPVPVPVPVPVLSKSLSKSLSQN